ncbi:DUF3311 domain-containing protein [Megasphaera hominis]|jgi:hypothetical protein|uniref:DUF3311 domain-containing protein n=1 Tax=Megasphaera hominis TaxID=159836 RepID=A0ABR6VHP3_9FIRM|nr:DUF3311 domain-containing protein [Megasphaera hominis]MBC3536815.1 DUF3311 domain-containing protein [Megasphaera hominis]
MRVLLTAIPFIWSVICLPFVNISHPFILGLPFVAFWELFGILVAVAALHFLWKIDHRPGGIATKDHLYMDPSVKKEDIR